MQITPTFESLHRQLIENYTLIIELCDIYITRSTGIDKWYWETKRAEAVTNMRQADASIQLHKYVES